MRSKWIMALIIGALLPLLVPAPSPAQRGTPMPQPGTNPNNPNNPRVYPQTTGTGDVHFKSKTITGEVVAIKSDLNSISVRVKDGKVMDFAVDPKTKLKADKKTELADKKDIELGDFQAGETVEVTVGLDDQRVHEIRLKRPKKS